MDERDREVRQESHFHSKDGDCGLGSRYFAGVPVHTDILDERFSGSGG